MLIEMGAVLREKVFVGKLNSSDRKVKFFRHNGKQHHIY